MGDNDIFSQSLAEMLESQVSVRNTMRTTGKITKWPSPQSIGVPSVKALALNVPALEQVATWFTRDSVAPGPILIDKIRTQVWGEQDVQRPRRLKLKGTTRPLMAPFVFDF